MPDDVLTRLQLIVDSPTSSQVEIAEARAELARLRQPEAYPSSERPPDPPRTEPTPLHPLQQDLLAFAGVTNISQVSRRVAFDFSKVRNMTVSECHELLRALGLRDRSFNLYDLVQSAAAVCDREGRSTTTYRYYLLNVWRNARHVPDYDWPARELYEATLTKFLPHGKLTRELFCELAALEEELIGYERDFGTRQAKLEAKRQDAHFRELAEWSEANPEVKSCIPDNVSRLFWDITVALRQGGQHATA